MKEKIDLVYTWVDGNKTEWQSKKIKVQNNVTFDERALIPCRYRDNNELKYSLRSVEKYIPWVNHIYIVTDNQCPNWLNRHHPKISIIDHAEIIPKEYLPTFNSRVIEHCIVNIPNLSEKFLYANDDFLVRKPVSPDFFFTKDDKPIYRFYKTIKDSDDGLFPMSLLYCAKIIKDKYGIFYNRYPHHNIDPYKKSDILECYDEFKNMIDKSIRQPFRTVDCLPRFLYHYYSCATNKARYKVIHKIDRDLPWFIYLKNLILRHTEKDSLYCNLSTISDIDKIFKKYNPKLFCINDDKFATEEDIEKLQDFYNSLYPEKSEFELEEYNAES